METDLPLFPGISASFRILFPYHNFLIALWTKRIKKYKIYIIKLILQRRSIQIEWAYPVFERSRKCFSIHFLQVLDLSSS